MRLLMLVVCIALACAGPASAGPRMYVGFLDDESFRWDADRTASFDVARQSNASVVRTILRWYDVAPVKPKDAADPWDAAYDFRDIDEFVRNAQQRGLEVLLTVWGTPSWANGGRAPNVPPSDVRDFAAFGQALADRYSGAHAGYPFVRFYSIWNEPNSPRFLQASDAAAAYAGLASAGVAGLKAGSPQALVALGETASRHAPASFMEAVARATRGLQFDAWAHHPYPPGAAVSPDRPLRWPSVGLPDLGAFAIEIDRAFHRKRVPLWVTEYAESTTAVTPQRQATDLARAVELTARLQRADMFVWLMLRDHDGEPWRSGLAGKPGLDTFRAAALELDPRNAQVQVDTREPSHVFHVPALELKWHIPAAAAVGVKLQLGRCRLTAQAAKMEPNGWVPVQVAFRPDPGVHYELDVEIQDVHGFTVRRTLELVGVGPKLAPSGAASSASAC